MRGMELDSVKARRLRTNDSGHECPDDRPDLRLARFFDHVSVIVLFTTARS